jgi:hypothetical protein
LLLAGVTLWVLRRRRAARDAALPTDERVVRAWERSLGALRRQGLTRQPEETPGEYAARVGAVERRSPRSVEADAVANLAGLVELACYTPRPCTPAQAVRADALATTIVASNRSHRRRHVPHQFKD